MDVLPGGATQLTPEDIRIKAELSYTRIESCVRFFCRCHAGVCSSHEHVEQLERQEQLRIPASLNDIFELAVTSLDRRTGSCASARGLSDSIRRISCSDRVRIETFSDALFVGPFPRTLWTAVTILTVGNHTHRHEHEREP